MRIHSVKLRNFISHKETVIEFPPGLTVIVGRNGAGKTSILDAISYALFKEHGRGKDENVINRRANSAQVQLIFSSGGRKYEITWRIERRRRALATLRDLTSGSVIFVDAGERTAVPELEKILRISKDVFLNAAYVRQGEIARLLDARPAERKEIISKLLGIEVLEKIWESLRTPIKRLEDRLEALAQEAGKKKTIEEELRKIEAELSSSQEKRKSLEEQISELERKLENVQNQIKSEEEKREKYEKLREQMLGLEKEISAKRHELSNKQQSLEIVQKAEEKASKLEELRRKRSELQAEVKSLEEKNAQLKAELEKSEALKRNLKNLSEQLQLLRSMIDEYVKKLERRSGQKVDEENFPRILKLTLIRYKELEQQLRRKSEEIAERIGELQGKKKTCLRNIQELESGGDVCPLCRRPIPPEHREEILAQLREELENLDKEIMILEDEKEEAELRIREASSIIEEISRIDLENFKTSVERMKTLREEVSRLNEELNRIEGVEEKLQENESELEERRKELADLESLLLEYEREAGVIEKLGSSQAILSQIHRISSEIGELERKKKELEIDLENLGYDREKYERLVAEMNNLHEKLSTLKSEHAKLVQKVESLKSDQERLRKDLAEAERAELKLRIMEDYLRKLKIIRECFGKDGVQKYARATAKKVIEHYARRFLQSFTLIYSDLRLDEDYNIYVYGPLGEQSVDSLSGGEKTAVALCLRLGIAAALTGDRMECILMDEPTTHLDPERRRELIKLLMNFRSDRGLIPQAIIVTHDAEVEQAADQVYHITLKNGYSHLEEVVSTQMK